MNKITLSEIEKATGGRILAGSGAETVCRVCTDSRTAGEGDLFVPVIGENHDAHKFIPGAVENGCRCVLTARQNAVPEGISAVLVDDTTKAMQRLSAWYLEKLNLKKIAVTGSVGKTSTRDMVYYILKERYVTGTTSGNFNNDIGVPLTIFSFDDSMEAAVLEIGMDHFGEIHTLVDIIRPDIGIITNIGISHIENLGSRAGILQAKMEITDFFGSNHVLVVNGDDDMLAKAGEGGEFQVVCAGTSENCGFKVSHIRDFGGDGISYKLTADGKEHEINLGIPGAHNALNSALAIAACSRLGITVEEAKKGLASMELTGKRLTVKEAGGVKVIDDTYNAAPDSMKSAIRTLMHTQGSRKIAVLGGMNELGEQSEEYHKDVGRFAAQEKVDVLVTIGEKAKAIAEGAEESRQDIEIKHFSTKEDFYKAGISAVKTGDVVMVKGSRAMEMELVADKILKEQE